MKALLPLLAAALLLPLAAPAQGQVSVPTEAGLRVLEDAADDARLTVAGQPGQTNGRWAAADLRALDVLETPEEFVFTLAVASLKASPEAPLAESTTYTVTFLHNDREFTVFFFRTVIQGASYGAYVQSYDAAVDRYAQVSPFLPVQANVDAGTMAAAAPRDLFVDREGNAPHPEVPFTSWRVGAAGANFFGDGQMCLGPGGCQPMPGPRVDDAMPNEGNGTVDLPIRYGIVQSGRARLFSETPTRASNGEATTIVYQVHAVSLLEGNQSFTLAASGLPAGWAVKLPAERITVPGNDSVLLPVVVTIPFTHEHGTYQKFLLELKSVRDPGSVGRIQLGVRYVDPPQPAGHHNVLWMHSQSFTTDQVLGAFTTVFGGAVNGLYMNAAPPEEDPYDAKVEVPGEYVEQEPVPPVATYAWSIPLAPSLELGLDFKPGTGNVSLPIKTTLPMLAAQLGGRLVYLPTEERFGPGFGFSFGEEILLAEVVPGPPVDLAANSQGNVLAASIVPLPETDYFAYTKGAGLRLDLEVSFTRVDGLGFDFGPQDAPVAQPGGLLDLPLQEYHDKVAQVFSGNSTLVLEALSAQDRTTNPGKMVLYNLTLTNRADLPVPVNLELTGTHLLWVSLLTPTAIPVHLDAGESIDVRVAVKVPLEADKGDTADIVLTATSASDLNVRSLARLYTTVDTGREHPDDASMIAGIEGGNTKKGTPGLALPLLALALLAALLVARRR